MDIHLIQSSEIEAARLLLVENGWVHRVSDAADLRTLISRSQRALVAVEDDHVVGFVRALCDDLSNGYLAMLVVDAAHRHKGIGRALVAAIVGEDPHISWILRAGRPEVAAFYEKLGFVRSEVAMERSRTKIFDT